MSYLVLAVNASTIALVDLVIRITINMLSQFNLFLTILIARFDLVPCGFVGVDVSFGEAVAKG